MVTPLKTISSRPSARAFTLIELLVVIGIIIILAALLFPTVDKVRKNAFTAPCMNNQKQIVAAMMAYAADNQGSLPDVASTSTSGESGMWYETISGYLDYPKNQYIGRQVLRCPAASKTRNDFTYGINYSSGPNRVFTRRAVGDDTAANVAAAYPGSQRLGNLSPYAILIADAYDPNNPESSLFYHPASPNWSIDVDKDGDGVVDSASSLGGNRKFNCIEPRHANGKAFVGVAADGSAKLLTIREWAQTPKYWGP